MSKLKICPTPLTDELRSILYSGFHDHAKQKTGYDGHGDIKSLVAYESEHFAGAVTFEVFWGGLHIKHLLVEEEFRGRGIALHLMEEVLAFGRENKCSFAYLETMSFQALEFYLKLGFILEFTRSGFDHGASFHYLRKNLN